MNNQLIIEITVFDDDSRRIESIKYGDRILATWNDKKQNINLSVLNPHIQKEATLIYNISGQQLKKKCFINCINKIDGIESVEFLEIEK